MQQIEENNSSLKPNGGGGVSHYSQGGRISSPKLRTSIEQSEDFNGLEEGVRHYDLLNLVKRAGKVAGFSSKMIQLLDYYMSFTRDCDWEEGASPIVYQALSKTALDMGVSERQIQKLEKSLFEAGALTWNDSGNHRRFGQRCPETGMILYAYGIDLTPLAYLKAELETKLHEKQLHDQAWMETKRQISWYRRQIKAMLAECSDPEDGSRGEINKVLFNLSIQYDSIAIQIRTNLDLSTLRSLLEKHKDLLYAIILTEVSTLTAEPETTHHYESEAIAIQITKKSSPKSETKDVHYKNTNQKQFNKLNTSSPQDNCLQRASNEISVSKNEQAERRDEATEENLILKTGIQHITIKQTLNAASERFREHIPLKTTRPMNWHDLTEAAYKVKTDLDISQKSWATACMILGRGGAAVCVLLTDQATQREDNPVRKPAAYFNAMVTRAKTGKLHLHKSIFGILKQEL